MAIQAFFNHVSLPASSTEEASNLITDMVRSLSTLMTKNLCKAGIVSKDNIFGFELAPGFTLSDYSVSVRGGRDQDLANFIARMSNHFPFLSELSQSELEHLEQCEILIPVAPGCRDPDIFAAALFSNGFMTSLGTLPHWQSAQIPLQIQECDSELEPVGNAIEDAVANLSGRDSLDQVSDDLRAKLTELRPENWANVFPNIVKSDEFEEWFSTEIRAEVQTSIMHTCLQLREHGAALGRPYVDQINNSNFDNMKELRVVVGGHNPVRILFAFGIDRKPIFLVGGFKDGNRWYDDNIPPADRIFETHQEKLRVEASS